ncbi:MAG: ATP-binding cassette domain-containing protein [Anaerolineae bacterium]|nr:ATP-binding cassette domain-containing protein [Anaerolineae bacterium]
MNITLKNIHKSFGRVHANNNINVTLTEGQIVGVLGENGAGKSTLMKILSGFQPADSGEIWIDDQFVSYDGPEAAIGRGIGMLQQDPLDVGAFTVLENFVYGRSGGILPRWSQAEQELNRYVRDFGFELDPTLWIEQLSIAQRQQLEIVRLFALGVKVLILDEPTTGISADQKAILFDALRRLAHDDKLIVLLVSHKLEDVIDLCDSVIVLRAGERVGDMMMPDSATITPEQISATKTHLVELMFGQEMALHERSLATLGETVMSLDDLHMRSKRLDISGVRLSIRAGEIIGLAGLDGSGQELFMRAACGLAPVHSGHIRLGERDLTGKPYRHFMQTGVIFGAAGRLEEGLIAGLTLTEHLALVESTAGAIHWPRMVDETNARIAHYNVRGQANSRIEQLSGGNQQRMLMALLPENPRVLILEQPTRGLDVDSSRWIWQQLLERRQRGAAILFSSPELDELVAYSDRILVFYAGRIYEIPDVAGITIDRLGHLIGGEFNG